MEKKTLTGHFAALFTAMIWGTTFISTKVLLNAFTPVEILFFRFLLGLAALFIVYPKPMKGTTKKQELTFAVAGLAGITLYYLLENIALTYTMASNVSVIVSTAPMFTVILSNIFLKEEKKTGVQFYIGFVVTMAGICMISFNGASLKLNPLGDMMSVVAAFTWGVYSVLYKKICEFGYHTLQTTRRVFSYGVIFMLPFLFVMDFEIDLVRFGNPVYLGNLLYLGLCACALCFATWNYGVKVLGAVTSSLYIYLVPVITVIMSSIILKEEMTAMAWMGTGLALTGLVLSERGGNRWYRRKELL